jgi:hypothetical protein
MGSGTTLARIRQRSTERSRVDFLGPRQASSALRPDRIRRDPRRDERRRYAVRARRCGRRRRHSVDVFGARQRQSSRSRVSALLRRRSDGASVVRTTTMERTGCSQQQARRPALASGDDIVRRGSPCHRHRRGDEPASIASRVSRAQSAVVRWRCSCSSARSPRPAAWSSAVATVCGTSRRPVRLHRGDRGRHGPGLPGRRPRLLRGTPSGPTR